MPAGRRHDSVHAAGSCRGRLDLAGAAQGGEGRLVVAAFRVVTGRVERGGRRSHSVPRGPCRPMTWVPDLIPASSVINARRAAWAPALVLSVRGVRAGATAAARGCGRSATPHASASRRKYRRPAHNDTPRRRITAWEKSSQIPRYRPAVRKSSLPRNRRRPQHLRSVSGVLRRDRPSSRRDQPALPRGFPSPAHAREFPHGRPASGRASPPRPFPPVRAPWRRRIPAPHPSAQGVS